MPARRGDRYFYLRRRADQNLDMLCVREKGRETAPVDANTLTPRRHISVVLQGGSEGRRPARLLGYCKGGAHETTVAILDVNTRRPLSDIFPAARYGAFDITPDHKALYYTKYTPGVGPRAYAHTMDSDPATDKEISVTTRVPATTSAATSGPTAGTWFWRLATARPLRKPSSIFRT